MTTRNWKTTSGSFTAPSNWDTGVPGAADPAMFNAGSGTITDGGTIAGLTVANGGTWTWTGQISGAGYNVNGANTLAAGAQWKVTGVPSQNGYMGIGGAVGAVGSLVVQAGASIVSTQPVDSAN